MRRAESGFAASERPLAIDKKIKDHVSRGRFLREPLDAAGGGMNALQECVKIQTCAAADHDFPIQHKLARGQGEQGGNNFRKIAAQRLTGLGLQDNFIALAKSQTAEAIPFGFIQPAGFVRQ